MSNKMYDLLKNISMVVLPALATLWLTLSGIWHLPYGEAIAATITALATFLGGLLKISSIQYKKEQEEKKDGLEELQ